MRTDWGDRDSLGRTSILSVMLTLDRYSPVSTDIFSDWMLCMYSLISLGGENVSTVSLSVSISALSSLTSSSNGEEWMKREYLSSTSFNDLISWVD